MKNMLETPVRVFLFRQSDRVALLLSVGRQEPTASHRPGQLCEGFEQDP